MQFFVNPRQETDRAVGEGVTEGLRFGGLDIAVAEAFFLEPFAPLETGFLGVGVGCYCVLNGDVWGFGGGGALSGDHVDVGGFAGGRVEEADCAGDPSTPIAPLGYYFC